MPVSVFLFQKEKTTIEEFMKNVFGFLSIVVLTGWSLFSISSCSDQYDDSEIKDRLDKVEDRVTKLEEWCSTVNSEIISLKGLITALENKDYVTGVETLEDGYRITFYKGGNIIIRNGKDGIDGEDGIDGYTPIIGVAKYSDGFYYWTVQTQDGNTDWLTDADGDMVRATGNNGKDGVDGEDGADGEDGVDGNNGLNPYIGDNGNWWVGTTDTGVKAQGDKGLDAVAPQVRINDNTNEWEISIDGGKTYTSTGVKATGNQGDSMFKDIDNSNADYVVLTLADGKTKITLPKQSDISFSIGDVSENNEVMEINQKTTIAVNFSSGLKEGFFSAIIADVITPGGIVTRAGSSGWEIEIIKPTFTNGTYNNDAAIIITPISAAVVGSCAIVRVTVIDNRGREITSYRPVRCGRMDLVLKETVAEGGLQAAV
ncbi:PL29 family lyase N-terminal domain-containing protein, partial [Bacteroides sp.]|uniref:PL29 family lyase N-terminal domain-containing protein n=1 Tax=Bacteroides sp. TaxID=29523 RepID=UPI00257FFA25